MQKLFLTMAVAFSTLIASAQFTVVTSYVAPEDGVEWEVSSLTDNMGIGYALNSGKCVVGLVKAGTDSLDEATYDLWGRYNLQSNLYISVQAPTEEMMDNLTVGLGYSYNVWKGLCIEPNYSMGLKEDEDGEREGSFNIGLSYKF
jgi:opacity protein-like surface antigen